MTVLFNCSPAVAEGDAMVIRHDVSFAVPTAALDIEESKEGTRIVVTKAVRPMPFLELRFAPPIPRRMAQGKILQVHCDEAGTYTSAGGGSWTIAKRCRVKNDVGLVPEHK